MMKTLIQVKDPTALDKTGAPITVGTYLFYAEPWGNNSTYIRRAIAVRETRLYLHLQVDRGTYQQDVRMYKTSVPSSCVVITKSQYEAYGK